MEFKGKNTNLSAEQGFIILNIDNKKDENKVKESIVFDQYGNYSFPTEPKLKEGNKASSLLI